MVDKKILLSLFSNSLRDAGVNEGILNKLAGRGVSSSRGLLSLLLLFYICILRLVCWRAKKKVDSDVELIWSNHDFPAKKISRINLSYKSLDDYREIPVNFFFVMKLAAELFFLYVFSDQAEYKNRRSHGETFLNAFEFSLLWLLLESNQIKRVYTHGTICRRMLFIGEICRISNIEHHVVQHGGFRLLDDVKKSKIDSIALVYDEQQDLVGQYFTPRLVNGRVRITHISKEKKFVDDLADRLDRDVVFFGTNPNNVDNNIKIINGLLSVFPNSIIYVSIHPRENQAKYYKVESDKVLIGRNSLKNCSLYVFRPTSYALDAAEEGMLSNVILMKGDRMEKYLINERIKLYPNLDEFLNLY